MGRAAGGGPVQSVRYERDGELVAELGYRWAPAEGGYVLREGVLTLRSHGRVVLQQLASAEAVLTRDEKELEAARNSDLLRAIINAMAEGLIFVTTDGQVALCNPAAKRWQRDRSEWHHRQHGIRHDLGRFRQTIDYRGFS